jgi:hypothetical protein
MSNFQGTFYMKKFFNVQILNISSTIYSFLGLLKSLLLFSSFLQDLQRKNIRKKYFWAIFHKKLVFGKLEALESWKFGWRCLLGHTQKSKIVKFECYFSKFSILDPNLKKYDFWVWIPFLGPFVLQFGGHLWFFLYNIPCGITF